MKEIYNKIKYSFEDYCFIEYNHIIGKLILYEDDIIFNIKSAISKELEKNI